MTKARIFVLYYLATGIELPDEVLASMEKYQGNPWFKKLVAMGEQIEKGSVWNEFKGVYTEVK
jgi:hypothetical protein